MNSAAAGAILTLSAALFGLKLQAQTLPQEVRSAVPAATLLGQAKMTFWGFEVYQATLWVAPGFTESSYEQSAFALELAYLRELRGRDIAERSITEMRRQAPMSPTQEAAWEGQMRALFPDVKAGDRITGVNQPGTGAVFWSNGRLLGEVRDPAFAKQFFGIWFARQTSEPQLRRALLTQPKAATPTGTAP